MTGKGKDREGMLNKIYLSYMIGHAKNEERCLFLGDKNDEKLMELPV